MKEIKINGQKYTIPEGWDDLTFQQYCELFFDLKENPDNLNFINTKNEVKIISRLIGIEEETILTAPLDFFNKMRELFSWLYVRDSFFYTDNDNEIEIDGIIYKIPTNDEMILRQHIDFDIVSQEEDSPKKFIELLSILLIPKDGKYTGDIKDGEILFKKLSQINCQKAFKLLGFFLIRENILRNLTTIYSIMVEEVNHYHQSTQNL
jgi:hypothetical protein